MKLTGACTLLSNALSSKAGQGTPLPRPPYHLVSPGSIPLCLLLTSLKEAPKRVNLAPVPQLLAEAPFLLSTPQTLLSVWQLRASLLFILGCGTENGVEEAQGLGENNREFWALTQLLWPTETPYPDTWNELSQVLAVSHIRKAGQDGGGGRAEEPPACFGERKGLCQPALGTSVLGKFSSLMSADATSPSSLQEPSLQSNHLKRCQTDRGQRKGHA